jgi:hypothetical protein
LSPKRASSSANSRSIRRSPSLAPSSFFERRLPLGVGLTVARAPGLALDLVALEQLGHAAHGVSDPPALAQIGPDVPPPGEIAGPELGVERRPGVSADPLAPAAGPADLHQGGQAADDVAPPPALRLPLAVAEQRGGTRQAALLTALQQAQQLEAIGRRRTPRRPLGARQRLHRLIDPPPVIDPHRGLPNNDPCRPLQHHPDTDRSKRY